MIDNKESQYEELKSNDSFEKDYAFEEFSSEEGKEENINVAKDVKKYLDEKYESHNRIGRGTYGLVYSARKTNDIAVKICHSSSGRLSREFSLMKELKKKYLNVPKPFKIINYSSISCLEMELLGDSLRTIYKKYGIFSEKSMLMITIQIIEIIQKIHEHGYLHNDIKPSNFCFGRNNKDLEIFVIDFGLSEKVVPENSSFGNGYNGTAPYISLQSHLGQYQSKYLCYLAWKDDLESCVYVAMEFSCGELPWEITSRCNFGLDKSEKLAELKKDWPMIKTYCRRYKYLIDALSYCRNLKSYEIPNYEHFSNIFRLQLSKKYVSDLYFEWNLQEKFDVESGRKLLLKNLRKHTTQFKEEAVDDVDFSENNFLHFITSSKKKEALILSPPPTGIQENNIKETIESSARTYIEEYKIFGNFMNIETTMQLCNQQLNDVICNFLKNQKIIQYEIRKSKIESAGLGLYPKVRIPPKTLIAVYLGYLSTLSNINKCSDSLFTLGYIKDSITKKSMELLIDSNKYTNMGRYINGKSNGITPNCHRLQTLANIFGKVIPVIIIYSIDYIEPEDEFIYDYGEHYTSSVIKSDSTTTPTPIIEKKPQISQQLIFLNKNRKKLQKKKITKRKCLEKLWKINKEKKEKKDLSASNQVPEYLTILNEENRKNILERKMKKKRNLEILREKKKLKRDEMRDKTENKEITEKYK